MRTSSEAIGQLAAALAKAQVGLINPRKTLTATLEEGPVTVFVAVDHCTTECVGLHAMRVLEKQKALDAIGSKTDGTQLTNNKLGDSGDQTTATAMVRAIQGHSPTMRTW